MEGECPPPPLLLYPPWAHSLPQGPEPSPSAEAGPVLSSHAASCPWTGLDSGSRHAVALPLLQAAPAQLEEQSPSRGTRSPCSLGSLCLTDCAAQTNGSPAQNTSPVMRSAVWTAWARASCQVSGLLFVFRGPRGVRAASGSRATNRGWEVGSSRTGCRVPGGWAPVRLHAGLGQPRLGAGRLGDAAA